MATMHAKSGRLTVVGYLPSSRHEGRPRNAYRCLCDCGRTCVIDVADFNKGLQKSCGCFKRERMRLMKLTHNRARTPEYSVWHMMKDRCYNPKAKTFKYYGARGILVCASWRDSFADFFADMGPRPSLNHSLDRRDNNRGYEPDNCRWHTSHVQSRNRRTTRHLAAFGKTQCVSDWATEYGLTIACLFARLRKGVPLEDALTIPLNDNAKLHAAQLQIRSAK